jgi:hypothetical protein
MSGEIYSAEGGYSATLRVVGKVKGDTIKGSATWGLFEMSFTAKRSE